MKTEAAIHPIQFEILKHLLFKCASRFSELNTQQISSDHFNFHLKALVEKGLVEKTGDKYNLTTTGKEFANRLDTENAQVEKQAKLSVRVIGIDGKKFLVQQRLKQPYFGYYGFGGGKIKFGETPIEAAARELMEETGLKGKLKLLAIRHKMDYSTSGTLLEDKYFFVFRAKNLMGELKTDFEGGRNIWLTEKEILKLPNLFDGVEMSIEETKQNSLVYREEKYTVTGF
jgi:8-oxo-dGTP pyrophosphatase MutT (NUDIX family)